MQIAKGTLKKRDALPAVQQLYKQFQSIKEQPLPGPDESKPLIHTDEQGNRYLHEGGGKWTALPPQKPEKPEIFEEGPEISKDRNWYREFKGGPWRPYQEQKPLTPALLKEAEADLEQQQEREHGRRVDLRAHQVATAAQEYLLKHQGDWFGKLSQEDAEKEVGKTIPFVPPLPKPTSEELTAHARWLAEFNSNRPTPSPVDYSRGGLQQQRQVGPPAQAPQGVQQQPSQQQQDVGRQAEEFIQTLPAWQQQPPQQLPFAQAAQLPPGTLFVGPDGQTYRRKQTPQTAEQESQ